jgi:hypothetical protein
MLLYLRAWLYPLLLIPTSYNARPDSWSLRSYLLSARSISAQRASSISGGDIPVSNEVYRPSLNTLLEQDIEGRGYE